MRTAVVGMSAYGQFCPVAKAMELLDERWTLLIVRELLCGSRHFNELRRGVPRMSPSLLSKRLRALVRAGVVRREVTRGGVEYVPTTAGMELWPVVEALGRWGTRWIPELGEADLDPHLLLWDIHRSVDRTAVPDGRTVIAVRFRDVPPPAHRWWLLVTPDDVDLCDVDPGFEADVGIHTDLRTLTLFWRGDLEWEGGLRSGRIALEGNATLRRALPRWLAGSSFAGIPRPQAHELVAAH